MYVYTRILINVHIYIYTQIPCICGYVYVYTCILINVHIHMCIYIYMYTYICTHIHTLAPCMACFSRFPPKNDVPGIQGTPAGSIRPDPAALDSTAFRRGLRRSCGLIGFPLGKMEVSWNGWFTVENAMKIWMIWVSEKIGVPPSFIHVHGLSRINHPAIGGTPICGNPNYRDLTWRNHEKAWKMD